MTHNNYSYVVLYTYGISFSTRSLFWPGIRTIISFISSFKCYFLIPRNPGHVVINKGKVMTRRIDDPKRMTHQGGLANEPINTQTEFKFLREREIRLNMKNGRKVISTVNLFLLIILLYLI